MNEKSEEEAIIEEQRHKELASLQLQNDILQQLIEEIKSYEQLPTQYCTNCGHPIYLSQTLASSSRALFYARNLQRQQEPLLCNHWKNACQDESLSPLFANALFTPKKFRTAALPTRLNDSPQHCSDGIVISQGTSAVFAPKADKTYMTVRSDRPIPSGVSQYYFEMVIQQGFQKSPDVDESSHIAIGLSAASTPLNEMLGRSPGSYGYSSIGALWAVGERLRCGNEPSDWPFTAATSQTIGCLVDFVNQQIRFTCQSEFIPEYVCDITSTEELWPTFCVYVDSKETKGPVISANLHLIVI